MKPTKIRILLLLFLLISGCDPVTKPPVGGNSDFLAWMQTMTKIRVMYSGSTDLHTFLKQGTLDPGNTSDNWLPREMEFSNYDSSYSISWQDSEFQTKACFFMRLIDPVYTLSSDCGNQSFIQGVFHSFSNSISGLACKFENYQGIDANNYQDANATLSVPIITLDSFGEDSIAFTLKNWSNGSISLGYNYDEIAYTTYIKQMNLMAYDTLAINYPNSCRVVFSSQ